jgi:hypothetical protein
VSLKEGGGVTLFHPQMILVGVPSNFVLPCSLVLVTWLFAGAAGAAGVTTIFIPHAFNCTIVCCNCDLIATRSACPIQSIQELVIYYTQLAEKIRTNNTDF